MKRITITPQAIISLLISVTLLVNTAAPAFAQVQKTPRFELSPSQQQYLSRQTYTAVPDGISNYSNQQARLLAAVETFSRGKLTNEQLARLAQINRIFTPAPENKQPKSDFEQFQSLYTQQIDKEFNRENAAMKASMGQMGQKITATGNNYRKEVYESVTHHVTARVLATQGNTDPSDVHNVSKRILNDIQLLSYNPDQPLNTQISSLATKYKNDPQATQILHEIAAETLQDNKYLLREQAVLQWKEQADTQLKNWYQDNFALLNKWKKQASAKVQHVFDTAYNPQLLQARQEEVRKAVRDLWAYKNLAPKAKQQLLTLAPVILPLRTLDGKSFFTQEQKNWLYGQYMQGLKEGLSCGKDNATETACNFAFLSITGLSMLTDSTPAANAIEEFMQAKLKTPYSVPALLTGTAALLSMKRYNVLGGFLHTATRNEYNIDNLDVLSIENLVNVLANINGQYLGEVSKYAQYPLQANPTDQTAVANAWEDMAHLLAGDGSPEALALLRKYGVEQCRVFTDTSITFKEQQKLVCAGIMPFLAGALASGKSGAAKYNPMGSDTIAGPSLNHLGHAGYISPTQAQQNARKQAANNQAFRQYAASMGLSADAMLARHLFLQSMGDLNAESELRLDTQLYKVYANSNPKPKPGFAITAYTRNSARYNAKRERQDRTQFWRKAGRIGDIAVLLWCLYDVSKWLRNGVKIARAMTQAATMARTGATVAQRAMMLRRLNIAPQLRTLTGLGTKIKNGMAPSVLAELPHFTTNTVQLPKFEGFVESAGKLVAQNMRFSAETGVLAADMPALTEAANGVYSTEQLNTFNGLLNTAATQANTQFANRSALQRFFTFNKDASYRSYLTRNLLDLKPAPGMTQADLHTLALQTSRLPVNVPQNIAAFKAPSFLETANGAAQLNMGPLAQLMTRVLGASPTAAQLSHTEGLLNTALVNTNAQFLNRNWLARQWSFLRGTNDKKYKNMLLDNVAAEFDKDGKMFTDANQYKLYQDIINWIETDQTLSAPAWSTQFRHFGTVSHGGKFHTMGTTLLAQPGATPVELPLVVQMQLKRPFRGGIKGVNSSSYQRVVLTEDKGNLFFGFGNDLKNPVKPSQFKLTLEETDMPALIRAAQGYTGTPLEIKLTSPTSSSFFSKRWTALKQARLDGHWNPISTLFRGKNNIYVHHIPVSIRQADGTLTHLPLTFKADSYLGLRGATAVLEEGGNLAWYRGRSLLQAPKLTYSLPKNQISPFLGMLQQAKLKNPLHIKALSGKNKIEPLMWATGLSLSSASTGLIAPLENVYGDRITEMDKTWISLAFPYVPSLAAPLFSPLVMKIGALRTLQMALGISTVGLGFAALNGFQGKVDKNNPPPVWPLFVSGMAIGVSSALSRSGLNLLIDSMGGGGTLLKSMAYKNIGSFALLLPPFVANFIDKDIDFSLAFPVLGTLSAGALTWVSVSRISTGIGKVEGFMPIESFKLNPATWVPTLSKNTWSILNATGKEAWSTTRLLATKQVLPLVLAATAFTGFEAGAFNKAGNQMIRPVVKNGEMPDWIPETNRNNYTAMLTNLSVITFPLVTRLTAKPVLKWMANGRAGDEYRHMLQVSFALNATGAGLLYANGFDGFGSLGFLGIGLMGMGTANMTQSFQKLSNISVKSSAYAQKLTHGLTGAAKTAMEKSLVTKTMTGFPVQQLGIAIVPTLVSGYTDRQIAEGTIEKKDAPHSSMWIPIASLALCFGLSMPHIGLAPARLPTGLLGLTKGMVGSYPGAINQLQQPQFYIQEPYFGTPKGFTPLLNNPILNAGSIMPSQKVVEKIENKLEREAAKPTSFIPTAPDMPAPQEAQTQPETHTL